MSPPTARSRPAGNRAATRNVQADEANAHATSDPRPNGAGPADADDALELFGAVIRHGAYGRTTQFLLPEDADPVRRRDRALADVEGDADAQDRAVIDQAIRAVAARGRPFSANDVRHLLPVVRTSLIGARFLAAAKAGVITRIGYVVSTDPGTHARPIAQWAPVIPEADS